MDVFKALASWFALASVSASFMACDDGGFRPEEPAPGEDGLSVEAADGAPAARWTYYAVLRADPRGGLWVARHNQPETKCADGSWQAECFIDTLDWSRAGLSAESADGAEAAARELRSVLRGKLVEVERDGGPVAVFQATESWEGELAGPATGTALWLSAPSGCESDACLLTMGTKLNKSGATLNTRYARVHGPAVAAHMDALRSEAGLLVLGTADRSATEPAFAVTHGYARRPQSEADSDRTAGPRCSASALTSFPRDELRVHVIDVGQGDAIWVQTPWRDAPEESLDVLIDAGPSGLIPHSSPGGDVVVSYMLEAGLREGDVLDALVVTHAHADHFGGVAKVAETFGIARYADPGFAGDSDAFLETRAEVEEHVHEHGGALQVPAVGAHTQLARARGVGLVIESRDGGLVAELVGVFGAAGAVRARGRGDKGESGQYKQERAHVQISARGCRQRVSAPTAAAV